MRFLRFLALELGLRGVVFTLAATLVLVGLFLASIGASADQYQTTLGAFWSMVSLDSDFSLEAAAFSAREIITSGAAITFPLALTSLLFLVVIALVGASTAASSTYLRTVQGGRKA